MVNSCSERCVNKNILAFCDTSTISLKSKFGRITDFEGLGIVGRANDVETYGFFLHTVLLEDENDGTPYGFSSVNMYDRGLKRSTMDRSKRDQLRKIPIELKESNKWLSPNILARDTVLSDCKKVTFIMDREGDIIHVLDRLPNEKCDVVIRSMHNRRIINQNGEKTRLHSNIENQKTKDRYNLKITRKNKTSSVVVTLKYGHVKLLAARGSKIEKPINISYVEVKQKNPKGGEKPIHWIILTNRRIKNKKEAQNIVRLYKRRWSIEVLFKLLKTDGYDIEKTELETGKGIRKLTLLAMEASLKILQLKAARTGGTINKTKEIFNEIEIKCLEKLNIEYQGNTEKQRNPYPKEHLAWASWVIARLGGWSAFYNKSRPPGNKTFKYGLERFEDFVKAYKIFT